MFAVYCVNHVWIAQGLGARASRPHPVPLVSAELPRDSAGSRHVGGNRNVQVEGEPWRRCRSIQVEEMAEAVPGLVRAGRPRSQEAFIHTINRKQGLHLAEESGKKPFAGLKNHSPLEGESARQGRSQRSSRWGANLRLVTYRDNLHGWTGYTGFFDDVHDMWGVTIHRSPGRTAGCCSCADSWNSPRPHAD